MANTGSTNITQLDSCNVTDLGDGKDYLTLEYETRLRWILLIVIIEGINV